MTYFVFTLGCKVNSYESSAIATTLERKGYLLDEKNPDVVVINTCSVTHVADQKSRQHIRKFRKMYPSAVLVVMGCFMQSNKEYAKSELDIDILLGTSQRDKVLEYIEQFLTNREKIIAIEDNPRKFVKYEELNVTSCSENIRAYLKVQDGCDNFCSYCLVPFIRGKSRSRDFDMCLKEAKELVSKGYKEIVVSGIHVGRYGKDIDKTFSELIKSLSDINGLNRLRISSIELSEIDDEFLHLLNSRDNIAKHLHLPLQSGSNNVLKKMGRKYTREEFINRVKEIKKKVPDVALTSDVIVGFPGETEEDFMDTYNLLKELGFYQLHVFPYSVREGTVAASLPDQISPKMKNERVKRLLELSKQLEEEYEKRFINQRLDVLFERFDGQYNIGHTSNYLQIKVKSDYPKVGNIENILIESNNIVKN
ncbi:MAG: tRNA (N(6)-L-threonylcarbamoyladenosine(37)-C(2))-methylthiotransferase MtaB [Erysipelotrichaceae bacterium]|nr:tRNA (N(6)-L-threonylcarbamoyladenosine(37)-C(2))-methylthiotransferase MtaB [Erysipelotrichaceae bacterium]